MIIGILATSLFLVICSPAVAQNSNVTVNLSADAMAIPDGYVVPEGSNVTFICSSSLGGIFWTLDLKVPGGTAEFQASVGLARSMPQVSSPDTMPSANPATIILHNVASENNQSTVECIATIMGTDVSSARVIVEGSPNCPTVNATVSTISLTVSIQKPLMRWLPEQFYVEVSYCENGLMVMVRSFTLKGPASFHVTSLELDTVYNISVIPCNMAGCNESCDIHSVQTADKGGTIMAMINRINTTSLLLICSPAVAQTSTVTVNLSADTLPIPDGYVVPEGSNVTFICSSSLGGVSWTLDLQVPGGTAEFQVSAGLARSIPQVSSPDTTPSANPATITIHNVVSENNQSTVECIDTIMGTEVSSARVIVEGSPNCPTINTTVNSTSLTVSIQKTQIAWLPEQYSVKVILYNESIGIVVYNSTLKGPASFHMTPLEPGTVYNITVIPCNMAGCNESCDIHSVQTESETVQGTRGQVNASMSDVGITFATVLAAVVPVVALLAITMVTTAMVIVACTYKRKKKPRKVGGGEGHYEDIEGIEPPIDDLVATTSLREPITRGGEGHYEDIEGVNSPYDDLVAMSTSLQGPNSSSVDAVHVHQASSQLRSHGVTSATAVQYINEGVTNDITMGDNPAYQSIEVAESELATMESTQSAYI